MAPNRFYSEVHPDHQKKGGRMPKPDDSDWAQKGKTQEKAKASYRETDNPNDKVKKLPQQKAK